MSTLLTRAGIGIGASLVANLATFFIAQAQGVAFTGEQPPGTPLQVTVVMVVMACIIPAIPATAVFGLLKAKLTHGARIYAGLAVVLGAASLGGPMGIANASEGTILALQLMHVWSTIALTVPFLTARSSSDAG